MLSQAGADTTAIATQIVQGELAGPMQQGVLIQMISGTNGAPQFGPNGGEGGSFVPPEGTPGAFPPAGTPGTFPAEDGAPAGFTPPRDEAEITDATTPEADAGDGAFVVNTPNASESLPSVEPTATAQPTQGVLRPTLITFPTATATPIATETDAVEESAASTCTITVDYNLNLRDAPNTDGTILLSIPFGTTVSTDSRTADGWYRVTYSGESGWVSGDYVTASATCADITLVDSE
jgi:hypothetical protein